MQNGQSNNIAGIVMADNDVVIGHIAVGCDVWSIWLGEVNGKCISLRIVITPETMPTQPFEGGNQCKIRN